VEGLSQKQQTTFVIGLLEKFAPKLERLDSGLLVVHNHSAGGVGVYFYGVQNPLASIEQTQQEKEELPTPEELVETLPGERGEEKWWAAYFNWEGEYKKKYKWTNRQGYELLAYSKSEYDRQKSLYKAEHEAL
jgi:hypothetical protein